MKNNVWDRLWVNGIFPDLHPELVKIVKRYSPGKKILEIGFGTGGDLAFLKKEGFDCFGLESSLVAHKQAVKNKLFKSFLGDGERIPFAEKKFDLIFHQGLLEHFKDPGRLMSEHWRTLKPNGVIVIDVPQKWNLFTIYKGVIGLFDKWYGGWERSYSASELTDLVSQCGFEVISIHYRGIWPHRWGKFLFPERIIRKRYLKFIISEPPFVWIQKLSKYLYNKSGFIRLVSSYNVVVVARRRPLNVAIDKKIMEIKGGGIKRYITNMIKLSSKENYKFIMLPERNQRIDVYHAMSNWGFYGNRPTVVTIHDVIPAKMRGYFDQSKFPLLSRALYLMRMQISLFHSMKVIFTSQLELKEVFKKFFVEQKKVEIIPMAVDYKFFSKKKPNDTKFLRNNNLKGSYMLCHGGIDRRKNLDKLLTAIKRINCNLVISGDNPELRSELSDLAKQLGIVKKIHFCGWVSDDEIAFLVRNAKAVVYPTKSEGFGLPMLESMAAGVPIVASNIEILRRLGKSVPVFVNPNSVDSITRGITKALHGLPKGRLEEGRRIAGEYTWPETVKNTCKVYFNAVFGIK